MRPNGKLTEMSGDSMWGFWKKGVMLLRVFALTAVAYSILTCSGCSVSREIVDLQPPADQPPLQQLESNLNYQDPDAGQPDYLRIDE